MATLQQLSRGKRLGKKRVSRTAAFEGAPQRKGVVYKVTFISPRKPNSAKRRIAKINLVFNGRRVFAKIPGFGVPGIQQYSEVFVEGGRPPDSPGINYTLIRGTYDFIAPEDYNRMNKRSKYGIKNFWRIKTPDGSVIETYQPVKD